MRLDSTQVRAVSAQLGAEPVTRESITFDHLCEYFGDHTFYLGPEGVYVWEPVALARTDSPQIEAVHIAAWADSERTLLKPQDPTPTGMIVTIRPS